jgi:hypothetical protein
MRFRLTTVLPALLLTAALSQPASAEVSISVDKSSQRMTVEVDGQKRYTWPVSTGTNGYDTPSGSYRPFRMERDHRSKEWDDAPMPHAIFFTARGHAIHGTNHTRQLGRPASHGCVRLSPKNAAALFSLIKVQGMANTRVTVEGSEPLVASRKTQRGFKTASRQRRFDGNGVVSAGMQTGQDRSAYYSAPSRRRANYRPAYEYESSYGYSDGYMPAYGYGYD